jgi:Putative Flp pilus-assembly TadE/G-like
MEKRTGRPKGQIAVIITLAIPVLIGILALCCDIAIAYANWQRLQSAADSGALAGATQFEPNVPAPSDIQSGCPVDTYEAAAACTYAVKNTAKPNEVTVAVPAPNPPPSVPAAYTNETVQVTISRSDIPSFFARALGRTRPYAVQVSAVALGPTPVGSMHNGLFPAALPGDPNGGTLNYGDVVQLTDKYSPGNWGWLDIPTGFVGSTSSGTVQNGGGAQTLASNITNGCTCDVSVGDWVDTKPGVQWGQVSQAVGALNPSGAYAPTDQTALESGNYPQLVTVPVVDWSTSSSGSSSPVKILGFAQVWVVGISKTASNEVLTVQYVHGISKSASSGGGPSDFGSLFPAHLVQ